MSHRTECLRQKERDSSSSSTTEQEIEIEGTNDSSAVIKEQRAIIKLNVAAVVLLLLQVYREFEVLCRCFLLLPSTCPSETFRRICLGIFPATFTTHVQNFMLAEFTARLKFLSFLQFHFVAFLPPPPPPWPGNTIEACFEIASSNLLTGRHERHILNYAAADPTKRTNSPSSSFRSKRGILSLMPCKKRNVDKDDGIH